MAEEQTQQVDVAEAGEGEAQPSGDADQKKGKRGLDAMALRQVRSARKLVTEDGPNPEADFMIASANVFAMLELAAAIRSHNESENGDSPS
jgi:hypothetical protein